jgi:miniconductance mechanosensitive channel
MKTWEKYEGITSDIFDHLLTIMSQFQLEIFEEPTGKDFRSQDASDVFVARR